MDTAQLRILVVEDDDDDYHLLHQLFGKSGLNCQLQRATSVAEARTALQPDAVDLALVDLWVTDSRGAETLAAFEAVATTQVALIVLTGATNEKLALDAVKRGAEDYLVKDEVTPQMLARSVRHAIERHRLRAMVTRTERMASVGQLSAGLAHELNSPLAYVLTELAELHQALSDEAPALASRRAEWVDVLGRALGRVEQIRTTVEALYNFSNAQQGRQARFEPLRAVRLARRLADNALRHAAQVEESLQPLPSVFGDEGRFAQAVLELLNHAGEVARSHRGRTGRVWLETYVRDGQVVVQVEDDGPPVASSSGFGLLGSGESSAEDQRRPWRGFGIAAVRETARAHGGVLESSRGRNGGACYRLRVPAMPTIVRPAVTAPPASSPSRSRARVLWIDDDLNLLCAFERRLRHDHDVAVCDSAEAALQLIAQGESYDVICCDLMMPGMSGRQFEAELSLRYPDLLPRLVFITGGVFTEEERRFLERSSQPRLLKPFEWSTLLRTVDQIWRRAG